MAENELIGTGRVAEVFLHGPDTVLRRYRDGRDRTLELQAMMWLHDQGLPVPRVDRNSPPGSIVMQHVPGPSMFDELASAPHTTFRHARTLARLQARVNPLRAPDWFPQVGDDAGTSVLHMDLHPMNIILGHDGPKIID